MELFTHLTNLTKDKKPFDKHDDEQSKSYVPYIINRFVSMCEMYVPLVNAINQYNVPKDIHYQFLLSSLPKRNQFFKYIKKKKDVNEETKSKIGEYFGFGTKDVEAACEVLTEKQQKEIEGMYEYGKCKK